MCMKLRHLKHNYWMLTDFKALEKNCLKLLYVVEFFLKWSMSMMILLIHTWCQYNFWWSNLIIVLSFFVQIMLIFFLCRHWLLNSRMYTVLYHVLKMLLNIADYFPCAPRQINQLCPWFLFKRNQFKANTTNHYDCNMDRT